WQVRLSALHGMAPDPGRFGIELAWGGAHVVVRLDPAWLGRVGQVMLDDGALADLPEALRLAVLEAAFAQAAGRIEAASGRPLRIVAARDSHAVPEGMEGFGLEWRASNQVVDGELWVDEAGLGLLAGALRARPA